MAIMVAGGLTFAIPGMEPAQAAMISSNPNLKVSAEGQNADNEIASTNIIQIIVSDGDVNASDDSVLVTVDGDPITMTFFSGAWYAYIADLDILSTGLVPDGGTAGEVDGGDQAAIDVLVTDAPITGAEVAAADEEDDIADSTLVQVRDLDGEFDIVYEKPANAQTVTLDLDDPASGISLDRTNYPQNTDVVATIEDQALNVDPTGADEWWFNTAGDPVYGTNTLAGNYAVQAASEVTRQQDIDEAQARHDVATDNPEKTRDDRIAAANAAYQIVSDAVDAARAAPLYDATTDGEALDTRLAAEVVTRDNEIEAANDAYTAATADDQTPDSPAFVLRVALEAAERAHTERLTAAPLPADDAGIADYFEPFNIATSGVLECTPNADCAVIDGTMWVKFVEDDSNESTFTNTEDDEASLKTTADASRSLSFELEYDNGIEGGIGYSTTNIVIDAGDDWSSGQEISITLTDSDANTNSLTEETLEVADEDRIIPTIKIGNPLTLAIADTDTVTVTTLENDNDPATGTTVDVDAKVTPVSDILVVSLPELAAGNHTLNVELGNWNDIAAEYFVQDTVKYMGAFILNYDLSSLGTTDERIKFDIENHPYTTAPRALPESLVYQAGDDRDAIINQIVENNQGRIPASALETFFGYPPTGFSMPISPGVPHVNNGIYDDDGLLRDIDETASFKITFTVGDDVLPAGDYPIIADFFRIGLEDKDDLTSSVNDAIYRLELVEDGDNSSDFVGTLEYTGLNQINIADKATYTGIDAISDEITLISDDSSISVEYHDRDATGGNTVFTAEADTPTHSGSVSLDSDGYKVSDTVMVTVEDGDLNADSSRTDLYTAYGDMITTQYAVAELLTVSIDGEAWKAGCGLGGLDASSFTLRETGRDSGVFTGTFTVPAEHCPTGSTDADDAVTVTGTDISVEYVDFRDDSGSVISVSASAGIRSSTGSVSLDRTVYPVPFGDDAETDTIFETQGDESLGQGDLTVYVSVTDSDADTSSNGIDSIDASTVSMEIIRGSEEVNVAITDSTISETAPDSGVFELEMSIAYDAGPTDGCPAGLPGCILQGDIIHVVYTDSSDASGSENTVTDSATFDLRNGVLQSDQTAYIIGSDAIITLIEPDLNLDSDSTETYTLDLIEWDSDAGTATLADDVFGATPSNLLETGPDTGIFQVVVSIPDEIEEDKLERGEEITLEYVDWGPSGSDHVGDKDESITATIYTSNFGATIELDQRVYTWTDKVYITVVAPDHNIDSDQVDEIGNDDDYPIRVSTRGNEIEQYKLVETGADTGIFTGEVILTGFANHDADGDGNDGDATGRTSPEGSGPTNGEIETESESGISVSFKYSDGETVSSTALIRWNVGEVQWLEASYPASGSGIVRVIDPDMNLNPEAVDNFDVTVFSDSDGGGISLTVTETNAATGIFEGTVFFGVGVDTSGHRLRVVEGDTVTAQYYDNTLPAPFKETERVRVGATTLIGTVVPPLERVPISDLRAVDSFGSTLDTISVDSQIQLAADLTNGQDKSQDFAYLIQIQDGNGVTVSLNWITGSLSAGQSLSPATSWTPDEAGTYEVTAFAWESIENPTALSPTATITITVN